MRRGVLALLATVVGCSSAARVDHTGPVAGADKPEALANEGQRLLKEGQIEEALAVYERAIAEHGPTPASVRGIARIYELNGERERGRKVLLALAASHPDDVSVQRYLAYFCEKLHYYREALAADRRVLAAEPRDLETLRRYGSTCVTTGSYEECLERLEPQAEPLADAPLWNLVGILQLRSGQAEKAIVSFRSALALAEHNALVRTNLGRALVDVGGHEEEAAELLEGALKVDAGNSVALYALASLRFREGRDDEGRVLMERFRLRQAVVEEASYLKSGFAAPVSSGAALRLGRLFERRGQQHKAVRYYRQALELEAGNTAAREALDRLGASEH